jgi:hypothetical protein
VFVVVTGCNVHAAEGGHMRNVPKGVIEPSTNPICNSFVNYTKKKSDASGQKKL